MADIEFGRLENLPLRQAWAHEAQNFTPWLAANIEHLSDAIGIPLELTGQEVPVEGFSADILARNPEDDSIVLIENQLERTDHTHLGQIMTYLAGLEAKTVIWIAPEFRPPHLTAIKWLNQHTADGFSFFAVKLRVVRIGSSPYAPIFEIVAEPDSFERDVRQKVVSEGAAYYDIKEEFWIELLKRFPDLADFGIKPYRYSNNYMRIWDSPAVDLAIWVGRNVSGLYFRSKWGDDAGPVLDLLQPYREQLVDKLGVDSGPTNRGQHLYSKKLSFGHDDRERWPDICDWMYAELMKYRSAFLSCVEGSALPR